MPYVDMVRRNARAVTVYSKAKQAHKCVRNCGHIARRGKTLCECCEIKRQTEYDLNKLQHICVQCGIQIARPYRSACMDCTLVKKNREATRKQERIAKGLCPKCGKRPPPNGYKKCIQCHERDMNSLQRTKDRRKSGQA